MKMKHDVDALNGMRALQKFRKLPFATFAIAFAMLLVGREVRGATHYVYLTGASFEPDQLSIAVGDTVIWENDSGLEHTSTSDDGNWDSDVLEPGNPGDSFSYVFANM